jgi:hypothetical protein
MGNIRTWSYFHDGRRLLKATRRGGRLVATFVTLASRLRKYLRSVDYKVAPSRIAEVRAQTPNHRFFEHQTFGHT